ncbi:MAG: L-rhamnose/proton symporter RhaT [Lentisphaerota bacterium]
MSLSLTYALLLTIFAGLINGACIAPKRYLRNWSEEHVWFCYYFNSMLLLPLVTIFIFCPNFLLIVSKAQILPIATLVIGGLFFGLGQVGFAMAFKHLGFSINFVITISIGTAFTALIGLIASPKLILSLYGLLQFAGAAVFILAVMLGGLAGITRDNAKKSFESKASNAVTNVKLGVFLSIIGGIGSAFEGSAFVIANPYIADIAMKSGYKDPASDFFSWIIIFMSSSIPPLLYFAGLMVKNGTLQSFWNSSKNYYFPITIVMGLGAWASVLVFSFASSLVGGELAPTIVWPMFMVFIILTSNMVGFISGEWKDAPKSAYVKIYSSIATFIIAIVVFSCSAIFK